MGAKEKIMSELRFVAILFITLLIIFMIVFNKESLLTNIRVVASITWLFILPGFMLMYYWHEELDFLQRIIIGTALAFAVNGVLSYYLGLIGLHTKFHIFLLPIAMIFIGTLSALKKKKPLEENLPKNLAKTSKTDEGKKEL